MILLAKGLLAAVYFVPTFGIVKFCHEFVLVWFKAKKQELLVVGYPNWCMWTGFHIHLVFCQILTRSHFPWHVSSLSCQFMGDQFHDQILENIHRETDPFVTMDLA